MKIILLPAGLFSVTAVESFDNLDLVSERKNCLLGFWKRMFEKFD